MKNYIFFLFVFILFSCSTKKNTFISRNYHTLTTRYNVYFNGEESLKEGEKKMKNSYKIDYHTILPIYISENESARSAAFSDMDRAAVKAMKAIKLHSITNKPKRRENTSERYKNFRKKNEFNRLIDDCYLLKGKADFYNKKYKKADKAFKFIIRQYPDDEIVYDARIWYGRSLVEQENFDQAKEQLRDLANKDVPSKYSVEILKLNAFYGLKSNNVDFAIDNIERLLSLLRGKEKARFLYILAQLYLKIGNNSMALKYFDIVSNSRVSYEMKFSAKINKAISYRGGGENVLLKELNGLLKDKKNRDYRDQIYYALANIYMHSGNVKKAVYCYWESTKLSKYNDVQKSMSFKLLGSYYYDIKDYKNAHLCYDSSFFYNQNLRLTEKHLLNRLNSLSVLVENLRLVSIQDSLQSMAVMPEEERNRIIDAKISKIKEGEEILREQKRKADLDRSFYLENQSRRSSMDYSNSSDKGGWYFYNQAMISSGRADFTRRWGRRKLEDNWNRKNKAIVDDLVLDKEVSETDEIKSDGKLVSNPRSREYYLQDIPLTVEKKIVSDSLILEALFTIGEVYSGVLKDYKNALSIYEDILKRYPSNKYVLYIYYSCYNCANYIGDEQKLEFYKNKITVLFPNSEYAKMVVDRYYIIDMQNQSSVIDAIYSKAYEAYLRGDYSNVVGICDKAIIDYSKSELKDKFILLKIYSLARLLSVDDYKGELLKIVAVNKNSEVQDVVKGIMDILNDGGVADKSNSESKVETTVEDYLLKYSFAPDSRHYFILSFPRTAMNLNSLIFRLNAICSNIIETTSFDVNKEMLGDNTIIILVSVFKNSEQSKVMHDAIIKDRKLAEILSDIEYKLFAISESNYKILKHTGDIDEYLRFYSQNYFDKEIEANVALVNVNREDLIFAKGDNLNHNLVILFPFKSVDDSDIKKALNKLDPDYEVSLDDYNSTHQAIVVKNVGYTMDAMLYFKAVESYFRSDYANIYSKLKIMIISPANYDIMYENKFDDEYMKFFTRHYTVVDTEFIRKEMESVGFLYSEESPHYFVLSFPNSVNDKKLLSAFRKYNNKNLPVEVLDFDKTSKTLIVSNLANKKQAMMYYRAINSNKALYRSLRGVTYMNFIISKENFEKMKSKDNLGKYFELFKKLYLN